VLELAEDIAEEWVNALLVEVFGLHVCVGIQCKRNIGIQVHVRLQTGYERNSEEVGEQWIQFNLQCLFVYSAYYHAHTIWIELFYLLVFYVQMTDHASRYQDFVLQLVLYILVIVLELIANYTLKITLFIKIIVDYIT